MSIKAVAKAFEMGEAVKFTRRRPDSRFLGFFSQGKLGKIDASGGQPQTLCTTGSGTPLGGVWGHGGVILFAPNSLSPLQSVSTAGGQAKPATVIDRSRQERFHMFPHFLPDGRHFLFLADSAKRENVGIYVGSLDTTETKRLLNVRAEGRYSYTGYLLFVRMGR